MFNYNIKELYDFISEKMSHILASDIQYNWEEFENCLGQGISRSAFYYPEFPDIVFKLDIGEDGVGCEDFFGKEMEVYTEAKEYGLSQFFAPMAYIGTIQMDYADDRVDEYGENYEEIIQVSVEVYIQQKVDTTWSGKRASGEINVRELEHEIRTVEKLNVTEISWIPDLSAYFLKRYGEETYCELSELIDQCGLDDLHGGNWGFIDDDLILIDYAM